MSTHALLLMNLGSPDSTEVADVRRYLNQFLMDPYVIDLPWPVRRILVSLILLKRPAASAEAYRSIWWDEGSPLVVLSRRLQEAVKPYWPHGPVDLAMRYGAPSIEQRLLALAAAGVSEVTLAPLYPQFADSTTTTAVAEAKRVIKQHRLSLKVQVLKPFFNDQRYLDALVESVKPHLAQAHDHVLLSFHGLPERHLHKDNPSAEHCLKGGNACNEEIAKGHLEGCYRTQCLYTAERFAKQMGLAEGRWSVGFQSRLGRAKWIEPYTEDRLEQLAAQGVKKLLVMCPAFVSDCIETLEEIADRGKEQFIEAGGEDLTLIPCLNDDQQWAQTLAELCQDPALLRAL